jgi:hypothetical protein
MFSAKKQIHTVDELISHLEHVEIDELQSDIPANVRAELKYMKSNISAILAYVAATQDQTVEPELLQAMLAVRRECIALNGMISKALLVMLLPVRATQFATYLSLSSQYESLSRLTHAMCSLAAPQLAANVALAL